MQTLQEEVTELSVPLLSVQHDGNEIDTDTVQEARGDLEQGLLAGQDAEAEASNKSEEDAIEVVRPLGWACQRA